MNSKPVTLLVPVAGRRRRVRVPDRMRLADLARVCLDLDQTVVEDAARASRRAGSPVSCRKGCGACCRHVVPVSPPEAWMLADLIAAMPPQRRAAVQARFADSRDALQRNFSPHHALFAIANEYFALGIACPFLENESCSIHADRPSVCREYMVTTPANMCAHLHSGAAIVSLSLRISQCLAQVAAQVLGTAPTSIALVSALDWAEENRADGRRTWESRHLLGLAGEAFRRSSAA